MTAKPTVLYYRTGQHKYLQYYRTSGPGLTKVSSVGGVPTAISWKYVFPQREGQTVENVLPTRTQITRRATRRKA